MRSSWPRSTAALEAKKLFSPSKSETSSEAVGCRTTICATVPTRCRDSTSCGDACSSGRKVAAALLPMPLSSLLLDLLLVREPGAVAVAVLRRGEDASGGGGRSAPNSCRKLTFCRATHVKRLLRQKVADPSAVLPALLTYAPLKPAQVCRILQQPA